MEKRSREPPLSTTAPWLRAAAHHPSEQASIEDVFINDLAAMDDGEEVPAEQNGEEGTQVEGDAGFEDLRSDVPASGDAAPARR